MDHQTDRPPDRQTTRQTDIPLNKWTARQSDSQTDRLSNRQSDSQTDRLSNRQSDRQTDRLSNRQSDSQTDRLSNRQSDWPRDLSRESDNHIAPAATPVTCAVAVSRHMLTQCLDMAAPLTSRTGHCRLVAGRLLCHVLYRGFDHPPSRDNPKRLPGSVTNVVVRHSRDSVTTTGLAEWGRGLCLQVSWPTHSTASCHAGLFLYAPLT